MRAAKPVFSSVFHVLPYCCCCPSSARISSPSRTPREQVRRPRQRCKRDEGQDWHVSRCLRAGHETLRRLVPTQGEQDFLTLGDNSERTFPNELSIRLKKNRHLELVRAGDSLENQKGLHFNVRTCTVFQRKLLPQRIWGNWCETAPTERYESLAGVDVVERCVYDYGRGSVSPVSKLPQLTIGTPPRFALPVMTDFESQKRSVLLPPTRVRGLLVATEMVDRFAATKPP